MFDKFSNNNTELAWKYAFSQETSGVFFTVLVASVKYLVQIIMVKISVPGESESRVRVKNQNPGKQTEHSPV
jgi:hypothetical protein